MAETEHDKEKDQIQSNFGVNVSKLVEAKRVSFAQQYWLNLTRIVT